MIVSQERNLPPLQETVGEGGRVALPLNCIVHILPCHIIEDGIVHILPLLCDIIADCIVHIP